MDSMKKEKNDPLETTLADTDYDPNVYKNYIKSRSLRATPIVSTHSSPSTVDGIITSIGGRRLSGEHGVSSHVSVPESPNPRRHSGESREPRFSHLDLDAYTPYEPEAESVHSNSSKDSCSQHHYQDPVREGSTSNYRPSYLTEASGEVLAHNRENPEVSTTFSSGSNQSCGSTKGSPGSSYQQQSGREDSTGSTHGTYRRDRVRRGAPRQRPREPEVFDGPLATEFGLSERDLLGEAYAICPAVEEREEGEDGEPRRNPEYWRKVREISQAANLRG